MYPTDAIYQASQNIIMKFCLTIVWGGVGEGGKLEHGPIAKRFDPGQPAQSAQADLGRHFLQIH